MSDTEPRPFAFVRDHDITGVSGPGHVADGVQWPDGTVAMRWRERPSTSVWDSLDLMLSVHGHDGASRVVWADEVAATRLQLRADVVEAFDVPRWVAGPETERELLRRQISRAMVGAWKAQVAELPEDQYAAAAMPIVEQILQQRDRAQRAAGRAYKLADSWQAAHGSAMLLVRAAGAELRDVLDDDQADEGATPYPRPATRAATQATEPIACDAYKPPTEPADSGLCARCGMFDYRHGAKERADRLEQQRNDVAQALREVLAGFREIPVPWGGDAVGYEAPHPIHPSNANRWRKVLDGLPVNCQKPGGCADCPHETEA